MATIALVPISFSVNAIQGAAQNFTSANAVQTPAGAAVDLSAWNSIEAVLVANNPNPCTADQTFGTCAGSALGILTLNMADTDLATVPLGSAAVIFKGKQLVGDPYQILGTGNFTLSGG